MKEEEEGAACLPRCLTASSGRGCGSPPPLAARRRTGSEEGPKCGAAPGCPRRRPLPRGGVGASGCPEGMVGAGRGLGGERGSEEAAGGHRAPCLSVEARGKQSGRLGA